MPKANPDVNIPAVRFLATQEHPTVYFDTIEAFETSEQGKAQNWTIYGIVTGRETTLQKSQKGSKRGAGSALIYRSETGNYAVLPNDGKIRDAANKWTIDGVRELFGDDRKMMTKIRNALRTNLEHRRDPMHPKKTIVVYRHPR
jgi:hypothetical protein